MGAGGGTGATPGARRTAAYNITTLLICSIQKIAGIALGDALAKESHR